TRKMRFLETYAGPVANGGAVSADLSVDPSGNFNNYVFDSDFGNPGAPELKDNGGWGQDGYLKDFTITDKLDAYRINAIRSIDNDVLTSIDFGVNYTKRTKEKRSIEAMLCIEDCVAADDGARDSAAFPGSSGSFNFG